jgi:hypothetical protein
MYVRPSSMDYDREPTFERLSKKLCEATTFSMLSYLGSS